MTVSHLTSSTAEMLAGILNSVGGSGSHLIMSEAEMLARINDALDDGAPISHLTTGQAAIVRDILAELAADGHTYDALTLSRAEMIAAISNDLDEGDGGGAPAWVPDGALIHIDLVRAFNAQDAAWVSGTGVVAVDTLLGTDVNTDAWFGPTGYNPADLSTGGLVNNSGLYPAFIGAARAQIIFGAGIVATWIAAEGIFNCGVNAATGASGAYAAFDATFKTATAVSDPLGGPNVDEPSNVGTKRMAITLTPLKVAANLRGGVVTLSNVIDATHWPVSGVDQIVAAYLDMGLGGTLVSVSIYESIVDGQLQAKAALNTAPTITNVDTTPSLSEEETMNGSTIVTVTASDDEGDPPIFSLTDDDGGNFAVHATTGVVTCTTDLLAASSPFAFTVRATDPGGLYVEQEFTITVTA